MILGPASAMRSRSDWSKPRIMAVMPTIDVMPITTPSTVSAERILFDQIVSNAITTTSRKSPSRIATSHPSGERGRLQTSDFRLQTYSYRSASMGSKRDALNAGHMPKKMPTDAEKLSPIANDHHGREMGKP